MLASSIYVQFAAEIKKEEEEEANMKKSSAFSMHPTVVWTDFWISMKHNVLSSSLNRFEWNYALQQLMNSSFLFRRRSSIMIIYRCEIMAEIWY